VTEATLYLVSTPIGNLADISSRALEVLAEVAVIYAEDTRRTSKLLRHYSIGTPLRSLHEHNEAARTGEVLAAMREGRSCALVSDAGTPTISDPGARVVRAVGAEGLPVVAVPGPSAITAALSVSGLPAGRFAFLGFPPRKGQTRKAWMQETARVPFTVVVFESPKRIGALLGDWLELGLGDRPCVVCRELTKLHEEARYGTVASLSDYYREREVLGEVTIVLAGRRRQTGAGTGDEELVEAGRAVQAMSREGYTRRDIVRRLQEEFGMKRNEAYELVVRVEGDK
jgi:16S rRNA (cytidine1402-2'-O)-methyltransferase